MRTRRLPGRSLRPALLAATLLAGCDLVTEPGEVVRGSGVVVEDEYPVGGFTGVIFATPGELSIEQGNRRELLVEGEENLLPYLRVRVVGRTLEIATEPGVQIRPTRALRFRLVTPALDELVLSGSGDVEAPYLDAGTLDVTLSGSGDIDLPELRAAELRALISGSGELRATGEVDEESLVLSGSGRFELRDLDALGADALLSGSGRMVIRVRDWLDARITGSGTIGYYGRPTLRQQVSGSGRVERLGS